MSLVNSWAWAPAASLTSTTTRSGGMPSGRSRRAQAVAEARTSARSPRRSVAGRCAGRAIGEGGVHRRPIVVLLLHRNLTQRTWREPTDRRETPHAASFVWVPTVYSANHSYGSSEAGLESARGALSRPAIPAGIKPVR